MVLLSRRERGLLRSIESAASRLRVLFFPRREVAISLPHGSLSLVAGRARQRGKMVLFFTPAAKEIPYDKEEKREKHFDMRISHTSRFPATRVLFLCFRMMPEVLLARGGCGKSGVGMDGIGQPGKKAKNTPVFASEVEQAR